MPSGRNIPPDLLDALKLGTVRLCMCVKVEREDGRVLSFTTHDEDVTLGGVVYEAQSAIQSTNIRQEVGGSADNVDVVGVLKSTRITDEDLRVGAYDNAQVTAQICDWSNPEWGGVILLRGNIGDIAMTDGKYTASMRSLMQRFRQQIGELYSPMCRVFQLGDTRCKFNLSGNTVDGHPARSNVLITATPDQKVFQISGGVNVIGFYNYGTLRSNAGRNAGYTREIKIHGDEDGLDEQSISTSSAPTGHLAFRASYNFAASSTLSFAIPAGVWESASLVITSAWAILDPTRDGTDTLNMQFPPGQANDVVVRSNSAHTAMYVDTLDMGDTTIALINAAAGGTMSMALRHTQPSSSQERWFNVDVSSAVLTLVGPGGGTSNRIVLHESFPFPVSVGEVFQITTGCNRLPGTCTQKFGNIINFRGEPNLPGTEKLLERGRPPS